MAVSHVLKWPALYNDFYTFFFYYLKKIAESELLRWRS